MPTGQRFEHAIAAIIAHREIAHPPAGQQSLLHNIVKIGADFGAGGQIIQTFIQADFILFKAAQFAPKATPKKGRLMQANKG